MTRFGKMLIFLNLVLSVVFAGWAAGVYTQRIDWAPARTLGGDLIEDRPGRVAELAARIKTLVDLRDVAEIRWQAGNANLVRGEQQRAAYHDWYARELATARTGIGADGKEAAFPVRQLIRDPQSGDLKMDPVKNKDEAVTVGGEPVKALDYYDEQYKDLKRKIEALQKTYAEKVKIAEGQAVAINGIPGKIFGLRAEVLNLKSYLSNANDEMAYLQPLYNGTTAELNTMQKRNLALARRLKELKEFAAANR